MVSLFNSLNIVKLGIVDYEWAYRLQKRLLQDHIEGKGSNYLLLLQHKPVITIGRSGSRDNILVPKSFLTSAGIDLHEIDRGGDVTYHGPGQLTGYPIIDLKCFRKDIHWYLRQLEEVIIRVLAEYGINGERSEGYTGVWVGNEKVAAIGVAIKRWITYHGFALNICPDMSHFGMITPCGITDKGVTSMERLLGYEVDIDKVSDRVASAFGEVFNVEIDPERRPSWLRKRLIINDQQSHVYDILKELNLRTVCQSAVCPNIAECFGRGTATFMILGSICTRNCRFCAVTGGDPEPVDEDEPRRLAIAVRKLDLKHVVITSVTRDDLPDGGAGHFANTIHELRKESPETTIEVLVPDFQGDERALRAVVLSQPDVFNHNLETVPRLYPLVRPIADYRRSLGVLKIAKDSDPGLLTKSGIMLGLGEKRAEVSEVMRNLRDVDCNILTVGQYLSPSKEHLRIKEYIHPDVFSEIEEEARDLGFLYVASGPFVRSSFNAAEAFELIGDEVYREQA